MEHYVNETEGIQILEFYMFDRTCDVTVRLKVTIEHFDTGGVCAFKTIDNELVLVDIKNIKLLYPLVPIQKQRRSI